MRYESLYKPSWHPCTRSRESSLQRRKEAGNSRTIIHGTAQEPESCLPAGRMGPSQQRSPVHRYRPVCPPKLIGNGELALSTYSVLIQPQKLQCCCNTPMPPDIRTTQSISVEAFKSGCATRISAIIATLHWPVLFATCHQSPTASWGDRHLLHQRLGLS